MYTTTTRSPLALRGVLRYRARMAPRIVRRLTMAEAATLLGWDTGKHVVRNTRDRLNRLGASLGLRLVWRGGGKANPSWTTWNALRHAGLIDDFAEAYRSITPAIDEHATKIAALARHLRHVAALLQRTIERVETLERGTPAIANVPARSTRKRKRKRKRDTFARERLTFPPVPACETIAAAQEANATGDHEVAPARERDPDG